MLRCVLGVQTIEQAAQDNSVMHAAIQPTEGSDPARQVRRSGVPVCTGEGLRKGCLQQGGGFAMIVYIVIDSLASAAAALQP